MQQDAFAIGSSLDAVNVADGRGETLQQRTRGHVPKHERIIVPTGNCTALVGKASQIFKATLRKLADID